MFDAWDRGRVIDGVHVLAVGSCIDGSWLNSITGTSGNPIGGRRSAPVINVRRSPIHSVTGLSSSSIECTTVSEKIKYEYTVIHTQAVKHLVIG